MAIDQRIASFLESIERDSGLPPLSEAKQAELANPDRIVLIGEGDDLVGIGAVAEHQHTDGTSHTAVETAVPRGMAFPAFETEVLRASLELVSSGPVSVWSHRTSLDRSLEDLGYTPQRSLAHMEVDLPLSDTRSAEATVHSRALGADEIPDLVRVNNAAFADHREAAVLTPDEVSALLAQEAFSFEGIRVIGSGSVEAFCWTKVHPNGDGEIYRIAVDPTHQGSGFGRVALEAGFGFLASLPQVARGTLWVDESNRAAIELYESIGMRITVRNREFQKEN
ncbi:MAG: GNAT family N-acetyltransferase [Acidimicrobiia bacterium]